MCVASSSERLQLFNHWRSAAASFHTISPRKKAVFACLATGDTSTFVLRSSKSIITPISNDSLYFHGLPVLQEYRSLGHLQTKDTVGVFVTPEGDLHFAVNEIDQGVACKRLPTRQPLFVVIQLFDENTRISVTQMKYACSKYHAHCDCL